jgi:hypothetical protein
VQAETFSTTIYFGGSNTTVYASGDAATVNAASTGHLPPYINVAFIQKTANNTPPSSSSATVSYASGRTRTGPNTTWGVSFTPSDSEQTGANALQYRITNSSTVGGGGTVIASGNCTSGSQVSLTGLSYTSLSEGNNTLYVHIFDGGLWSNPVAFTVSRDSVISAPTGLSVSPDPTYTQNYSVTFNAPDTTSTNTNEMRWEIRTAANGGGTLIASGNFTQGNSRTTGTVTDTLLVHGANTRYLRIYDGAWNAAEASFTVNAIFNVTINGAAADATADAPAPALAISAVPQGVQADATADAPAPNLEITAVVSSAAALSSADALPANVAIAKLIDSINALAAAEAPSPNLSISAVVAGLYSQASADGLAAFLPGAVITSWRFAADGNPPTPLAAEQVQVQAAAGDKIVVVFQIDPNDTAIESIPLLYRKQGDTDWKPVSNDD